MAWRFRDHRPPKKAAIASGHAVRQSNTGVRSLRKTSEHTFALCLLARQLAGAADGFGFLAGLLFGRLLEMLPQLHLTEDAFALKFLLQGAECLIDVVIANTNLHVVVTTFLV